MAGLTSPLPFDYPWLCSPQAKRDRRPAPDALTDMFTVPIRLTPPANSVNLIPEAPIFSPLRIPITLTSYAFNRWLAPRIRKFINEVIIRSAQGCDIPGAVLAYASPWPLPLPDPVTGLPQKPAARLEESASQHAAKAGPAVRGLLATALLDGIPLPKLLTAGENPFNEISLVHTSYFDDPDVLALIALHITRAHGTAKPENDGDSELGLWLDETSETVSSRFDAFLKAVQQE